MNAYEEKLKKFLKEDGVEAELLTFTQSCHSVDEAAEAAKADKEDIIKNICLVDSEGNVILSIVKGEDRASTKKIAKALNIERPRTATPEEILKKTGYPCGGLPSFGFKATFLIDPKVMEKDFVLSSGGSDKSLLRISPKEIQSVNKGRVVRVRK